MDVTSISSAVYHKGLIWLHMIALVLIIRTLKFAVWSLLVSSMSALLNWISYRGKFSLKLMKANGRVPLGQHQHLDLALVQRLITYRQISAFLSCQLNDFHHSSLSHYIYRRSLKTIHKGWLLFDPWRVTHKWRSDLQVYMWGQTFCISMRIYPNLFPILFLILKSCQHWDKNVVFHNFQDKIPIFSIISIYFYSFQFYLNSF